MRDWANFAPCRRESQVHIFTAANNYAGFDWHNDCMHHCQKIANGRSPPVNTKEEWESLTREVDLITPDRHVFNGIWLSATEGDKREIRGDEIAKVTRLSHWPKNETINNETIKLEAAETVWRDFYTGKRLADFNWTKPYFEDDTRKHYGDTHNCMFASLDDALGQNLPWNKSWSESKCFNRGSSCPCSYPAPPIIRLRGWCSDLVDKTFYLKQLPRDPTRLILLGQKSTRIQYWPGRNQWILIDETFPSLRYELSLIHI